MNVIDWLNATADYLVSDRPDVYDKPTAIEELSTAMDILREYDDHPVGTISFTSYMLTRIIEDEDMEEFILSRKAASLALFTPEEECTMYAHMTDVNLPHILDEGLDPDLDL